MATAAEPLPEIAHAERAQIPGRKRVATLLADVASQLWKRDNPAAEAEEAAPIESRHKVPVDLAFIDASTQGPDQRTNCDLCNRLLTSGSLLCNTCADMIQRIAFVDARMKQHEMCEAERLSGTELADTNNASTMMPC